MEALQLHNLPCVHMDANAACNVCLMCVAVQAEHDHACHLVRTAETKHPNGAWAAWLQGVGEAAGRLVGACMAMAALACCCRCTKLRGTRTRTVGGVIFRLGDRCRG